MAPARGRLLVVPMLKENELVGTIGIYRQEVLPFTDKQIELVQNFRRAGRHRHREYAAAQRTAPAHRRFERSLEQQTATSGGAKVISSSPGELEPVFQAMLENATRICQAKFGTMNLYDGNAFRNVALTQSARRL